jgi:hypothetical protein
LPLAGEQWADNSVIAQILFHKFLTLMQASKEEMLINALLF